MKKQFSQRKSVLTLVLLLILLQGCAYSQSDKQTVCFTKTGKKYHRCSCHYLKYSSYEITIKEAMKRGYSACSVCKPAEEEVSVIESSGSSGAGPSVPSKSSGQNSLEIKTLKSQQCAAFTKSGLRCKRTTTASNGKCWQHQ